MSQTINLAEAVGDRTFTYGVDGGSKSGVSVVIPYAELPLETLIRGFDKAARHVFGNELASKGIILKGKNLSEADIAEKLQEAADAFVKSMKEGTWGTGGTRGPRMTADQTLEDIEASVLSAHVTAAIKRQKYPAVEGAEEPTYIVAKDAEGNDIVKTFNELRDLYTKNTQVNAKTGKTLGVERAEAIQKEAARKYTDMQERKAAREREANVQSNGEGFAF